jgi:hypothetical protein
LREKFPSIGFFFGKAGKIVWNSNGWIFSEGDFCSNRIMRINTQTEHFKNVKVLNPVFAAIIGAETNRVDLIWKS